MIYSIFFTKSGTPQVGLSPSIDCYQFLDSSGVAGSIPSILEIGYGIYSFVASPIKLTAIRINSNDSSMSDSDRYKFLQISPNDGNLVQVVIPPMTSQVFVSQIQQNIIIEVKAGTTPTFTGIIGNGSTDYSNWTIEFGAKKSATDTEYAMAPRTISWTDATTGAYNLQLTVTDTANTGKYVGEIKIWNGSQVQKPLHFTIQIDAAIINP